MFFLNATDPATIKLTQDADDRLGLQGAAPARIGLAKTTGVAQAQTRQPPATVGMAPLEGAGHPLHQQADARRICRSARRARCSTSRTTTVVPIIRDPAQASPTSRTPCSTFPAAARSGCSRRWDWRRRRCSTTSARRRCCRRVTCAAAIRRRRPATTTRASGSSPTNRVLFHRVANTLNYLDIKTVIVSCGTCMDQLQKYEFDKIFPGCRLLDIHEYLMEKGVKLEGVTGTRYMYHDPCHTPMKTYAPLAVVNALMGAKVR